MPLDKNIRPPSEMKKKILLTIFKLWKSDIWKVWFRDICIKKNKKTFNSFFMYFCPEVYIYTLRKTTKPVTLDYKFISIQLRIFEISKNTKKKLTGLLQIF